MPIGTVAPPPMACITLAGTIQLKLVAIATNADPIENTIRAAWNIRTRP